ncbi:MAG: hypothetical protein QM817_02820 [Archangium sp.]
MTKFTASLFTICALAACGPDGTLTSSREESSSDSSQLRQIPPPVLSLRYEPSAKEKQVVADSVATNFPGATVTVSASRGTIALLSGFELQLRCTPGRAIDSVIIESFAALPDVFRIDASEWAGEGTVSCAQVSDGAYVTLTRQRAGSAVLSDQTAVVHVVKSLGGRVSVNMVVGWYLPPAGELEKAMSNAVSVEDKSLLETIQNTSLPYTTFDRCVMTGSGKWQVASGDEVSLDKPRWAKNEDATGTTMWQQRVATIVIAPGNVKPELIQSDAYCPPRVGWRVTADSLKGQVVGSAPGLGCVVCLGP